MTKNVTLQTDVPKFRYIWDLGRMYNRGNLVLFPTDGPRDPTKVHPFDPLLKHSVYSSNSFNPGTGPFVIGDNDEEWTLVSEIDYRYRYTDVRIDQSSFRGEDLDFSADTDLGDEYPNGTMFGVELHVYPVRRYTPAGAIILHGYLGEKLIINEHRKKWAAPTREAALVSFITRKNIQIGIIEPTILKVKTCTNLAITYEAEILSLGPNQSYTEDKTVFGGQTFQEFEDKDTFSSI